MGSRVVNASRIRNVNANAFLGGGATVGNCVQLTPSEAKGRLAIVWSDIGSKPTTISGFGLNDAYTQSQTNTLLSGKADLVGGYGPSSQIPSIAIVEFLGSVSSQSAMLALSGQKGDWAIRTDTGTTWVISGSDPTQISSWQQLAYPTSPVTSVNGFTGPVVLTAADLGAVPYTGATTNVNLGSNSLTAGAGTFNGTAIVNQPATTSIALRLNAIASATENVLALYHSSGNLAFYVTSGGQVVANRAGSVSGSFAAAETGGGYAFQGGWGGTRANAGTPTLGNLLDSPYGWDIKCGSGYAVNILNGANPMCVNLYNTFVSTTNREYLKFRAVAGANFEIGSANGSAGGTLRGLTLGGYANDSATITPWLTFTNTGAATFAGHITLPDASLINSPAETLWGFGQYRTVGSLLYARTTASYYLSMNTGSNKGLIVREGYPIGWGDWAGGLDDSPKTAFINTSVGVVEQRSIKTPTTAQTFSIANTWASSTDYEYGTFRWQSSQFRIGASVGSGGGTGQSTVIGSWNSAGTWTPVATFASTGTTTLSNTLYTSSFSFMVVGNEITVARDAANRIEFRNSTNGQKMRWANTYTSSTNNEFGQVAWESNQWRIGATAGSTGGTVRDTVFGSWNAAGTFTQAMNISGTTWNVSGPLASAWTIAAGTPVQAATTTAGNNLTIRASSAVAGSSTNGAAAGGSVFIYGGDGTRLNSGVAAGGDITLRPGSPSISGTTPGTLYLTGALGNTGTPGGDVRITGGTATHINSNLQMGHVYISTVGGDSYFLPGTIQLSTGFGSRNTNAGGAGFAGGAITQTTGYGGAGDLGGGIKAGGNGGAFTYTTGYGGAASTGTTSNTGGNGGAYNITTGIGGASTGTSATGGNGGAVSITSGAGGNGATTNGNGGNITFTAGIAGAGAGTAGVAGTITFNQGGVSKFVLSASGITLADAVNVVLNTTTGTKIGTATTQKIGLWNATPIVQPTTAITGATRVVGVGAPILADDTFDGYTIAQLVAALRSMGCLA